MMFDNRKLERYAFTGGNVEYTVDASPEEALYEASVVNYNQSGLCLLSANPIAAGQMITIKHFMASSSLTAVVMWVEEYDDIFFLNKSDKTLFKLGLLFV